MDFPNLDTNEPQFNHPDCDLSVSFRRQRSITFKTSNALK